MFRGGLDRGYEAGGVWAVLYDQAHRNRVGGLAAGAWLFGVIIPPSLAHGGRVLLNMLCAVANSRYRLRCSALKKSLFAAGVSLGVLGIAHATEGGASLYLPGLHGPGAGFIPPPGFYFEADVYSYSGRTSASLQTPLGGAVLGNVAVEARAAFFTPTWVLPGEILGGNLAIGVSLPIGLPIVSAGVVLASTRLNHPIGFSERDATFNIGDPIMTAALGWHSGKFHWSTAASVSIPAGAYQPGELSNLAFNRWIGDFSGALTYLDPALGLDISGTIGFEVNGVNRATDYRSGNGFHADLSISKNLNKEWSVGLLAGHYQQLTGDSGSGATVGPHKGRVTAVGGTVGYSFELAGTPISTRLKLLREVEVSNRAQGTIVLFTIALPLMSASNHASKPSIGK